MVARRPSRISDKSEITAYKPTFGDLSLSCKVSICFSDRLAQRLQLRVFGLGSDEDGNVGVGVGVFPESDGVATAAALPYAPFRRTAGQNVGGRARSQFSSRIDMCRAPDRQC